MGDFAPPSAAAAASDDDAAASPAHVKRPRKTHHSADYRQLVRELCGGDTPIVAAKELSLLPNAPAVRTIQSWLHDGDASSDSSEHRGRHFSLTDEQLLILTGFLLFVLRTHRTVNADVVLYFILLAFGVTHETPWVSNLMPRIGFSHHRATSLPVAYAVHDTLGIAVAWIRENQEALLRAHASGHLVAMDQIAFWDNVLVTGCYAPIGGYALGRETMFSIFRSHVPFAFDFSLSRRGQPRTRTADIGTKHIVYSAFCSDGSCLPPFIITSAAVPVANMGQFHTDGNPLHKAYVVYLPGTSQASGNTTEMWLEHVCRAAENYLPADSSIVMDVASWHVSKKMLEVWNQRNLNAFFLPAASGRWINPCDQSIHREMRRTFTRLQQHNPKNKLQNVITAYYSVTDSHVLHSWDHTRLLKGDYEAHLAQVASEGYRPTEDRKDFFEAAVEKFDVWAGENVRRADDVLPGVAPVSTSDDKMDGRHWMMFGTSRK